MAAGRIAGPLCWFLVGGYASGGRPAVLGTDLARGKIGKESWSEKGVVCFCECKQPAGRVGAGTWLIHC